jgi:tetratricopeptide (TPR) repeat protein
MNPKVRIIMGLAGLLCGGAIGADQPGVWGDAARGLVNDASRQFEKAGTNREAQFGLAVTLVNVQPKTSANIERAATVLEGLRGNDELGITATYYLARLEQAHRFTPDPEKALALYDQLYREQPVHPLAQMGVVKAALLRLYVTRLPFEEVETTGANLSDPDAVRDFHLVLADAAGRLGLSDEQALNHLLAAEQAGLSKRKTVGDAWVRIGELARLTGKRDLATQYYGKFLKDFPNDQRAFLVRERLASLQGGGR